jgi:acyl-CoA thioesterase I
MSSLLQIPRMRAAVRRVKAGGERFLGGVLPGASARRLQIRAFADDWAASNLDARQQTGPLWIVLGDSASQGIGATRREAGYVGVVHEQLRRRDAWRVINLSRAGAGVADVLARQLPELIALTGEESPALVSCIVGTEDIVRRVPALDISLRQVLAALPSGSVVATFARGSRGGPAAALDAVTREEAARHRLRVAELPPRFGPGRRGQVADVLGDVEHAAWAQAVIAAIDGPPAEVAPSTDPELPVVPAAPQESTDD